MLDYTVTATPQGPSGSIASARTAEVQLDTTLAGRDDAPMLDFQFQAVSVRLRAAGRTHRRC
jgi:hypothetical protein